VPINNRTTFLSKLELEKINEGLQQTFPALANLNTLKLLSDGFSSYVILIGGEIIFRIAKTSKAMHGHMREHSVLPHIQGYLPFRVPEPAWQAEPSEIFPFGVIGYRAIPGIPFSLELAPSLNLKYIAHDLARFLVRLHDFPLDEARAFGFSENMDLESLAAEVMPVLSSHFSKAEYGKFSLWWEKYLNDPVKDSFIPKLIHGDPWGENIILDERLDQIVGIIDFESVSIGDAAQDFAAQKYLGSDFSNWVIKYYRELGGEPGSHFSTRLIWHSMLRELGGLKYAIRYPESGELGDCLQKVRNELLLSA
jgi:aminoglycoside phosphotransferase (APT) family kinase protein